MFGQVPGRHGGRPDWIRRSRRCHFGWSPASPHRERRAHRRAARTRQRPRPALAALPGPTPTTPRILTGSRRRNWPPGPPAPARSAPCLIRTPAQRAERRACNCRMRPGATPCLLDARARQQAPGHRGVRPPLSCQRGMAAPADCQRALPNFPLAEPNQFHSAAAGRAAPPWPVVDPDDAARNPRVSHRCRGSLST
jgi:hypothetical protein